MTYPHDRPKWAETIPTAQLPLVLRIRLQECFNMRPMPETIGRKEALKLVLEWEGIVGYTNLLIDLVIGAAETQALENGKELNRG